MYLPSLQTAGKVIDSTAAAVLDIDCSKDCGLPRSAIADYL